MYSMVLMMAMASGPDTASFGNRGGCCGTPAPACCPAPVAHSCHGGCHGHGILGLRNGCHGGGIFGLRNHGCCGAVSHCAPAPKCCPAPTCCHTSSNCCHTRHNSCCTPAAVSCCGGAVMAAPAAGQPEKMPAPMGGEKKGS